MYSKKDEMNFPALFPAGFLKVVRNAVIDSSVLENGRIDACEKGNYGFI